MIVYMCMGSLLTLNLFYSIELRLFLSMGNVNTVKLFMSFINDNRHHAAIYSTQVYMPIYGQKISVM